MHVLSPAGATPAAPTLPRHGVATEVLSEIVPPLPRPKPSRIAVIGCGVKIHFPWQLACERYGKAVNSVRQALDGEAFEIVRASEPFEDPEVLLRFLDDELPKGMAGVILFHAAYTAGEIGSYLGRWLADHAVPLLSW